MQQNKGLNKTEINAMIKFGADAVFNAKNTENITDADIDAILAKGKERTEESNKRIKEDMAWKQRYE